MRGLRGQRGNARTVRLVGLNRRLHENRGFVGSKR